MSTTLYQTARHAHKGAVPQRQLAYHLDDACHGHVEASLVPGCYLWYPHGRPHDRVGHLVEAAALVIAPAGMDQITMPGEY